ncbi:hypothetical protein [Haliea sp.]
MSGWSEQWQWVWIEQAGNDAAGDQGSGWWGLSGLLRGQRQGNRGTGHLAGKVAAAAVSCRHEYRGRIAAVDMVGMMTLGTCMMLCGIAGNGFCSGRRLTALMLPGRQAGRQNQ